MPDASQFEIRVSNFAFKNLIQIHHYISEIEQQPITANLVVKTIEKTIIELIPVHPHRYPECPSRRTVNRIYRQAFVKNFKVIFKLTDKIILIIAIIHSSRGKSYIKKIPAK
jgi:mRNA-degrading endonuclease RelE of RelBE toxin-antitoxin system